MMKKDGASGCTIGAVTGALAKPLLVTTICGKKPIVRSAGVRKLICWLPMKLTGACAPLTVTLTLFKAVGSVLPVICHVAVWGARSTPLIDIQVLGAIEPEAKLPPFRRP